MKEPFIASLEESKKTCIYVLLHNGNEMQIINMDFPYKALRHDKI